MTNTKREIGNLKLFTGNANPELAQEIADYLGVKLGHQVPRFAYEKSWGGDEIVFKAPFYTAIWHNYDREGEYIELVD